jgi:excinuclease ABC subunit C
VARLKQASVEEITTVPGIGVATARAVLEALGAPADSIPPAAVIGDDQSRASG